jgi:hypothetical protein
MHSGSLRGNAEPTGSVLKNTLLPPSSFPKQPFGLPGFDVGPAYVFPLAAAAMLQASSVAIRT